MQLMLQYSFTWAASCGRSSIQSADLNGDGRPDLVVVNNKGTWSLVGRAQSRVVFPATGSVSVLLGNGDGTFQAPHNFAVGIGANSVAVGDFRGGVRRARPTGRKSRAGP